MESGTTAGNIPSGRQKKKNLESGDAEAQKEGQRKNLGNKTEALMYLRFF
jgi:hypothetical protein